MAWNQLFSVSFQRVWENNIHQTVITVSRVTNEFFAFKFETINIWKETNSEAIIGFGLKFPRLLHWSDSQALYAIRLKWQCLLHNLIVWTPAIHWQRLAAVGHHCSGLTASRAKQSRSQPLCKWFIIYCICLFNSIFSQRNSLRMNCLWKAFKCSIRLLSIDSND